MDIPRSLLQHTKYMTRWLRIAHRGASGYAPENTLASFRRALEMGTDVIEMDAHLTRDGKVVIIHEKTLDRTTNMRGVVAEMSFEEVRQADAGIKRGEQYRGERVPSLSEALEVIPKSVAVWVEIKALPTAVPVVEVVQEMGRTDQITAISFHAEALRTARARVPHIQSLLIFSKAIVKSDPVANGKAMLTAAQAVGTSQLSIECALATPETVAEIHRLGGTVYTWTADKPERIQAMIRAGVDGITCNYPDRLNAAMRRSGATLREANTQW